MDISEAGRKRGWKRWLFPHLAALLICVYALFDPASAWWMPKCPVHFLTGLDCPGCGSQRAVHALLHGRLYEAWAHNALLVLLLPYLVLMGYAEAQRRKHPRLYRSLSSLPVIIAVIGAVAVWTVIRNL